MRGKFFRTAEYRKKISDKMKGRKLSAEVIAKISQRQTGVKLSQAHKTAISKGHSGNKSHLWKGGITPELICLRSRSGYKNWRNEVLERDGRKCVKCGENKKRLVVHHKKSFADFPDLRLDINNGETLCDKCHHKTSDFGWKKYHAIKKQGG